MTPITHITPREQALQRENERLTDQVKRQSATIHVQAVAIQSMTEEIEGWKADQKENIAVTVKQQEEIAMLKDAASMVQNNGADAERYRWMRDGNDTKHSKAMQIASKHFGLEWNDLIDNAMKETK